MAFCGGIQVAGVYFLNTIQQFQGVVTLPLLKSQERKKEINKYFIYCTHKEDTKIQRKEYKKMERSSPRLHLWERGVTTVCTYVIYYCSVLLVDNIFRTIIFFYISYGRNNKRYILVTLPPRIYALAQLYLKNGALSQFFDNTSFPTHFTNNKTHNTK